METQSMTELETVKEETTSTEPKNVALTYDENTVFLVQRGRKDGAYTTKAEFKGSYIAALSAYDAIILGNGDKKRIAIQQPGARYLKAIVKAVYGA